MKDVFFDTNLSSNLINPVAKEYKDFLNWLFDVGALVMTNKLEVEYGRGDQNLIVVIHKLTIEGRLNRINNRALSSYSFPKRIERRLLSNNADRVHIKCVILSNRKMAIVGDNKLQRDINNLPRIGGVKPVAENSPSMLNYK